MAFECQIQSQIRKKQTKKSNVNLTAQSFILGHHKEKPYRLTPLMITLYEGVITHIDIQKFIEIGLQIVRFRMTHVSLGDKLRLIKMLKTAQQWVCEKYEVTTWPVAICIDLPNAAIRTGYFDKEIKTKDLFLEKGKMITITSAREFWDKQNSTTVYIDDPYTIQVVELGSEITLCGGGVKLICRKIMDTENIYCECIKEGELKNNEFVTIRGIKYKRPILLKTDLDFLALAMTLKADVITVFAVRKPTVIIQLRKLCNKKNFEPLFISTICEEEGLSNFDSILEAGKPFFVSGLLQHTLSCGKISECEISDVANGVLQGCGFVIRHYSNADHLLTVMNTLDDVCKSVESTKTQDIFWRIIDEYRMPVDAAEACVIACALLVRQTDSLVVVLPTVSGKTAVELTRMAPSSIIITVSKSERVANKLQVYRGVCAVIYEKHPKHDWYQEMEARIQFAVQYGIQRDILTYGNTYVTFKKSSPHSSFPDNLSIWTVTSKEYFKARQECDDFELASTTTSEVFLPTYDLGHEIK